MTFSLPRYLGYDNEFTSHTCTCTLTLTPILASSLLFCTTSQPTVYSPSSLSSLFLLSSALSSSSSLSLSHIFVYVNLVHVSAPSRLWCLDLLRPSSSAHHHLNILLLILPAAAAICAVGGDPLPLHQLAEARPAQHDHAPPDDGGEHESEESFQEAHICHVQVGRGGEERVVGEREGCARVKEYTPPLASHPPPVTEWTALGLTSA